MTVETTYEAQLKCRAFQILRDWFLTKIRYKVPVKAVSLLAKAIEKLINSPEKRNAMGKYSRQKAEQEFDQKEVVATHIALFESIM